MGRFLPRRLCRDSAQRRFFEGLRDLVDAGEDVRAVAGPFVGPIGQMADRIANVLDSPFFSTLIQQFRKLFERSSTGSLRHPAGKHSSATETDQDGHHHEDAGTPVSHPADIARFSEHPAQKHPGGEQHEEHCEKIHHGEELTGNAGRHHWNWLSAESAAVRDLRFELDRRSLLFDEFPTEQFMHPLFAS